MSKNPPHKPGRPATTLEGKENKLISLALKLVEKKLIAGTASSQEVVHFLKLASTREQLEQQRLQRENLLLAAKVEQINSGKRLEDMFAEAIRVMKVYTGGGDEPHED